MKKVRCPQCGEPLTFDETRFVAGQKVMFVCEKCGKLKAGEQE